MAKDSQKENLLAKGGKQGAIIGAAWIGLNIVVPLALLRIPVVQKYLIALKRKIPFDLPGVGQALVLNDFLYLLRLESD